MNHSTPAPTPACRRRLPSRRNGFIIVLVLGFVTLLAWLSVAVSTEIRRQMQLQGQTVERYKLRPAAYQTLELVIAAIAEINELDKGLYAPVQGWGDPLRYLQLDEEMVLPDPVYDTHEDITFGTPAEAQEDIFAEAELRAAQMMGENSRQRVAIPDREPLQITLSDTIIEPYFEAPVRVSVDIEDESGKVAINHASPERLKALFEVMGFDQSEADLLADSLLDWIDKDDTQRNNGAETQFYQQLRPPYRAANRPIRDLHELRLVNGFRTLFFDENGQANDNMRVLAEAVSVYKTDNTINFNTAPELVLQMLEEESELPAENIIRYLAGADLVRGTADDRVLRPDLDGDDLPRDGNGDVLRLDAKASLLKVTIRAGAGNSVFTLRALLDVSKPSSGGVYPFTIVKIVENGELN